MRVLLTRLSALGDIVHTWPLAEALHAARPAVELTWLVERPFRCLVEHHPAVKEVVTVSTRHWRKTPLAQATRGEARATVAALRAFSPDLAIDPQGLVKSAIWGALAGAPEKVGLDKGWRRERLAGLFYDRTLAPSEGVRHVVDINASMTAALGVDAPQGATPDGRFLLGHTAPPLVPEPGTVLLLPGTGGAGKTWGLEAFGTLATWLLRKGLRPVVGWGPGELPMAEALASRAGSGVAVAPPTSIVELAEVMSRCAAVVGGDTGPIHLAASLGVPTVAVFVATDPERNGPRGRAVRVLTSAQGGASRGRARTRPRGVVEVREVQDALQALLGQDMDGA